MYKLKLLRQIVNNFKSYRIVVSNKLFKYNDMGYLTIIQNNHMYSITFNCKLCHKILSFIMNDIREKRYIEEYVTFIELDENNNLNIYDFDGEFICIQFPQNEIPIFIDILKDSIKLFENL